MKYNHQYGWISIPRPLARLLFRYRWLERWGRELAGYKALRLAGRVKYEFRFEVRVADSAPPVDLNSDWHKEPEVV